MQCSSEELPGNSQAVPFIQKIYQAMLDFLGSTIGVGWPLLHGVPEDVGSRSRH